MGQTVVARLMESQIWHLPAGSMALSLEGSDKGQWPLPTFLSGRKLSPCSYFDARYFSSSLYATGAFQAATMVLELRGNKSKSVCGFFKGSCLGLQKFLPPTQSLLDFAARNYENLSS